METKPSSNRLCERLARPVDIASLAVFRILFGLVMAGAMLRFIAKGWVETMYLQPAFHFPWQWLPWVRPLPGVGMHLLVGALAALALGIAVGFRFKLCAWLFFIGFTYLEFLDQTAYLNHYYLVSLLAGLLALMPAHRAWSVDAWRKPRLAAATTPAWTVGLLRFQIGVVYVFAGLAKLNADWLLHAQPLRIWLAARSDLPVLGGLLAEPWAAYAASWGGAIYDLSIPFLLLTARARPYAYAAVMGFHALTAVLFPIGMFPWIMMAATLVFFPPDWPRSLISCCGGRRRGNHSATSQTEPACVGSHRLERPVSAFAVGALTLYCLVQITLPLRSWLYPHQGAWDGRGFNFAWRVMLVEKTGHAELFAVDRVTGRRERIRVEDYLTPRQRMMMAQDPHLIREFARHMAAEHPGREIRADAFATLNGRPSQRLVRADVNMAADLPPDWIVPLQPRPSIQRQLLANRH